MALGTNVRGGRDRNREGKNGGDIVIEFHIQPLVAGQIAAVAILFEMQLAEHGVARSQEELVSGLTTLLAEPGQGFVLVALAEEKPIGVAYVARILSLEHGGWSGWLDELYVLPLWREQGVGSALLSAAIAGATARAWESLDLEVDSNHQRVIPLYERNRFAPVHRTRFVRYLKSL